MSYANRFPSTQHTRYRSSWGPTSVSVFNRTDVPRPSPEEEEFADFYHERLHSAQSRQLIPLQEDLADWINKTISEYITFLVGSRDRRAAAREDERPSSERSIDRSVGGDFHPTNERTNERTDERIAFVTHRQGRRISASFREKFR